jgi:transcriptional regulator GlxA family with amidase domain
LFVTEHERIYAAAIAIVADSYPLRLTTGEVARQVGCTPRSVQQAFVAAGDGLTLREHLRKVRLNRAAELLVIWPTVVVDQIARSVGYPSRNHFASEFRREFGSTPVAFRCFALNPELVDASDRHHSPDGIPSNSSGSR